jgi:hypothetical protein
LFPSATSAAGKRTGCRVTFIYAKEMKMKKAILTITLVFFSTALFAQEETLFGSDSISIGGYGAAGVRFTQMKGDFVVLSGGYGGVLFDHHFLIGAGGFGLVSHIKAGQAAIDYYKPIDDLTLDVGYGGGIVEYIGMPNKVFHFNAGVLVGAGAASYRYNNQWNLMNDASTNMKTDVFFVVEPSVNLELNLTTWMRACIGGSYRFITGVGALVDLQNSDLRGASGNLTFKFGKF